MAASKDIRPGYAKFLDAWTAPEDAGDPIGCLATTFTFDPAFFEEECLGRFLMLETDAGEDGAAYLIEREEKLAQVVCAAVLVDQHHCRGARSLRWDLFPARSKAGIFHAKISLLQWSNRIRLMIGSANLTPDGYRRNREVFGTVDYFAHSRAPVRVLMETVRFLRESVSSLVSEPETMPVMRMISFLDRVSRLPGDWGKAEESIQKDSLRIFPVLTGPGREDLFSQAGNIVRYKKMPHVVKVLSPFFDPPETPVNRPVKSLSDTLIGRGECEIQFCLEIDESIEGGRAFAHAPANILNPEAVGKSCGLAVGKLTSDLERSLHAKELWLEGDDWALLVEGSSNFTSAGTGIGKTRNYEANIAYLLNANRVLKGIWSDLCTRFPDSKPVHDPESSLQFEPLPDAGIDAPAEMQILPPGFLSAVYRWIEGDTGSVQISFGKDLPAGWAILSEEEKTLFDETCWDGDGHPSRHEIPWSGRPPSGFLVTWKRAAGWAWWPVNVESSRDLPAPDELKDLPLDVLMGILTSSRPLHIVLKHFLRKKINGLWPKPPIEEIDPHKRVDVSGFFLQKTRRFSSALNGLRQRLERPVTTAESLYWRLHGPVGVEAFVNALKKEAGSEAERDFLLAELALEVIRAKPQSNPGCLSEEIVRTELLKTATKVLTSIPPTTDDGPMARYIQRVKTQIPENG